MLHCGCLEGCTQCTHARHCVGARRAWRRGRRGWRNGRRAWARWGPRRRRSARWQWQRRRRGCTLVWFGEVGRAWPLKARIQAGSEGAENSESLRVVGRSDARAHDGIRCWTLHRPATAIAAIPSVAPVALRSIHAELRVHVEARRSEQPWARRVHHHPRGPARAVFGQSKAASSPGDELSGRLLLHISFSHEIQPWDAGI